MGISGVVKRAFRLCFQPALSIQVQHEYAVLVMSFSRIFSKQTIFEVSV